MTRVKQFFKDEIVLIVSFALALISSFFVGVDSEYIGYIDFRTLGLLLCLMLITAAFNSQGVFSLLATKLLGIVHSTRTLSVMFCLLCFLSSMVITNDVSLITFVPFTILTLEVSGNNRCIIPLVVLETIAANLGSMLTPIGNPQNLYLFSKFDMTISDFIATILPYAVLSLVMILLCCLFIKNEPASARNTDTMAITPNKPKCIIYTVLFILAMLTVFKIINAIVLLLATAVVVVIMDRRVMTKADYSLLLTFVFLFVFIGNLSRIDAVSSFLSSVIIGNEVVVGVLASQVLSNVPCAILLSGFSANARDLLIGVNLGGLGTLIASMASLISFKLIAKTKVNVWRYVVVFTVLNIVFLVANLLLWIVIK